MTKKVIKRYSTAFKRQVVQEYENGCSLSSLRNKYCINGSNTVESWIKRYSHQGLRHQLMIIQSPEEQDEVKKLKEHIARLEKAVTQLTLDKLMLEATLKTAEEELGEDVKKSGAPPSSKERTDTAGNKGSL